MIYMNKAHLYSTKIKKDIVNGNFDGTRPIDKYYDDRFINYFVDDYNLYESDKISIISEKLNWPIPLVNIVNTIFMGMEHDDANNFIIDLFCSSKENNDMTNTHLQLLYILSKNSIDKYCSTDDIFSHKALSLLKDLSDGKSISKKTIEHTLSCISPYTAKTNDYYNGIETAAAISVIAHSLKAAIDDEDDGHSKFAIYSFNLVGEYSKRYQEIAKILLTIIKK